MAKRHKLSNKASQKNFRHGTRTHGKNLMSNPLRGGIRL